MTMTASMLGKKLEEYENAALAAVDDARKAAQDRADTEREYKRAWSLVYAQSKGGSHAAKKADADADEDVEMKRHAAHLAEALWTVGIEALRTKRAVLSSAQTWASTVRTEMELGRTGPQSRAA